LRREFGDFQTPLSLVEAILECLSSSGKRWSRVLEPTCGRGNFIEGLFNLSTPPREIQAIEFQGDYVLKAGEWTRHSSSTRVTIKQANIFDLNFQKDLQWHEKGPLLVVGNPPWVTNSELGSLGSENLPHKSNIKKLKGFDARTGESNFDIAESIWLKLIKELASEQPTIALLCKTSVARNVLQFAFDTFLPITNASIYMIDAKKWFGAAVEACLFCVEIGTGEARYEAAVYPNLCAKEPIFTTGIVGKRLVANVKAYRQVAATDGVCPVTWRQGLKHDAASVMELTYDNSNRLRNKPGETVIVESEYLYPLLKSSDLYHGTNDNPKRAIIVTQKKLGEDTNLLEQNAPLLWNYLTTHINIFGRRKSSIYIGQPPFAIFGIGDYSFAPYKVGISGFHKAPRFRAIGPVNGRPVMLDDTCYFIPCYTSMEAAFLVSLLNDPVCLSLVESMIFLGAKRPITKKLLQRIDLISLYNLVDKQAFIARGTAELELLEGTLKQKKAVWPSSMEDYLVEYFQNASITGGKKKIRTKGQLGQIHLFSDSVTAVN
jgi:hypothetical protein